MNLNLGSLSAVTRRAAAAVQGYAPQLAGLGAGIVAGPAAALLGSALSASKGMIHRASSMAKRPDRATRTAARRKNAPLVHRLSKAGAQRAVTLAQYISTAWQDPTGAFHALAHEVTHLSHQVLKGFEDIADNGVIDSGDFWKNLRRGGLHLKGSYFNSNNLVADFAMLKAARLVEIPEGPNDLKSLDGLRAVIAPKATPIRVPTGCAFVTVATQPVGDRDIFGFSASNEPGVPFKSYTAAEAKAAGGWPRGSFIFHGPVPHLAIGWRGAVKMVGSVGLLVQKHGALKVASLLSETLGDIAGLADGLDIAL